MAKATNSSKSKTKLVQKPLGQNSGLSCKCTREFCCFPVWYCFLPISLEIPWAFANAISPPPKCPQRSLLFASPAGSQSLRTSMFNSKFEIANIDLLLNTIYSVVVEPVMNNPLRHTTMGLGTSRNYETWKLI